MDIKIEGTNVLKRTLQAKDFKIIVEEGGSRSSKTWSIFQYFILKALQGEQFVLTIARANLTWIKATLLKDFEEIAKLYKLNITPEINPNRPEQTYKLNGSEFAFFGLDYAEKLHGRTQDYVWINEVMEIDKKSFDQLEMRTKKQLIIDYNPADDTHWVFDLQKRPDVTVIKSTMLDNPFLPETIIKKIKSYEPTPENIEMGTADLYMWEVYGLGNKAKLQGAIFTNWDILELPETAKLKGYGKDFGYTNDPTTLIGLYMQDNEIWLDEMLYQSGLTNQDIVGHLKTFNIKDTIWADSSEPKSIEEIKRGGFDIRPVDKGQDSINYGIDIMKQYKIHITPRSINLQNEFRKYKWAEDKNGKSLNKPIDAFNHAIDGARYVCMMVLGKDNELYLGIV